MSTRRAAPGSEFAPEKFASSAAFERGLIGSLVARRCTNLEDPKDKELIWFVHFLSHWGCGLKALAAALPANYPEHFGTPEMVKLGKHSGNYNAEQVRNIRRQLPDDFKKKFPLRGESASELSNLHSQAMHALRLQDLRDSGSEDKWLAAQEEEKAAAAKHPNNYPADDFVSICRRAAASDLEESIQRLCLDPECSPSTFQPWYFAGLMDALRGYFEQWVAARSEGLVVTEVGQVVVETLDCVARTRQLTLIEGVSGTGKSFAAESWCEMNPGKARFITVPTGNDETSFFRALARGLGIGNFAQYKAMEIRERVESVLLTGDIVLVLAQAWRLWPQQTERRFGTPKRINWVLSMADEGIGICLVSTPAFLQEMTAKKEKGGWDCAQLIDRCQYQKLPDTLSMEDLTAVAAAHLPEATNEIIFAIADYARTSRRYLGTIKTISNRARYLASHAGRQTADEIDVERAMNENVIPSNSNLVRALESRPERSKRKRALPVPAADSQAAPEPLPLAGSRAATTPLLSPANGRAQIESVNA
jgi:hypothetical protein